MAYSTAKNGEKVPIGDKFIQYYTLTDVQTGGSDTTVTDFRKIFFVGWMNKTATRGLQVAISGGTITWTSETNDDDFEVAVHGV